MSRPGPGFSAVRVRGGTRGRRPRPRPPEALHERDPGAPAAGGHDFRRISVAPGGESVQRSTTPGTGTGGGASAPPIVEQALRAPGQPLEPEARAWAEGRLGGDFSGVRVHADGHSADAARAVGARAYTEGGDIVFGEGQYAPASADGRRLLLHELTHTVQQRRASLGPRVQRDAQAEFERKACEANAAAPKARPGECLYKWPENCPTYGDWLETFLNLKTFQTRATPTPGNPPTGPHQFPVLGDEPADRFPMKGGSAGTKPPVPTNLVGPKHGEHFIDHPTDTWVKTCLPENLRATAYALPADCADVAIILRHVWLAAHHRTQEFGKYTLGSLAGKPEEKDVLKVIDEVGTGSVAGIVGPYTDAGGDPLVSFEQLDTLLQPGDILVWAHFDKGFDKGRTGGHTHTIVSVERDSAGKATTLHLLQGNEPIFGESQPTPKGQAIPASDDKGLILQAEGKADTEAARSELGHAPGRRVETATLSGADLGDSNPAADKSARKTWKWGATTLLVAAGQPKSVARPGKQKGSKVQQLTDWIARFKGLDFGAFPASYELLLQEARTTILRGDAVSDADARATGKAAGERFWKLSKEAARTAAGESALGGVQFQRLRGLLEISRSVEKRAAFDITRTGTTPRDVATDKALGALMRIRESFELAARGEADVDFTSGLTEKQQAAAVNVLLTGFDPFEHSGSLGVPEKGTWNPSGAAVLALDGQRLDVASTAGAKARAAVEGVVLPVDYAQFKGGLVEQVVGAHVNEVDAVLTISEDPNIAPGAPVRLERYAVGVHHIGSVDENIPAAPGQSSIGPAIVESNAKVTDIATGAELKSKKAAEAVPRPDVGEDVTFQFADAATADAALKALGLPAKGVARVEITDAGAIQRIASTAKRGPKEKEISFTAGSKTFSASVISGPGGSFLSNEVSFRVLRLLAEKKLARDPISFHTHTQGSAVIPQDESTKAARAARKTALESAIGMKDKLVQTMKRVIQAVGTVILDRRAAAAAKVKKS